MSDPDVHVIVVSYNSAGHLPGLIASMGQAAGPYSLRITVVDNASTDDSLQVAGTLGVQTVQAPGNVGYAAGINLGRHAPGPVCRAALIANPDVRFTPGSIATLFEQSLHHRSVTVPRMLNDDGTLSFTQRREATLRRAAGEALLGDHWPSRPPALSSIVRDEASYGSVAQPDWATGAVLMVPGECDDALGDWPEEYFLYSEETDYCERARAAGFPLRFIPGATVRHSGGASGSGGALVALDAVNRVRYYRSRHPRGRSRVYAGLILLEQLLRSRDPAQWRAAKAVWEYGRAGARTGVFPDGRDLYEELIQHSRPLLTDHRPG